MESSSTVASSLSDDELVELLAVMGSADTVELKATITGKLARFSALHPWKMVTVWIVVLVVALATIATAGDRFTMNEEFRVDLESRVADDLITERLNGGEEDPAQERVIVSSTSVLLIRRLGPTPPGRRSAIEPAREISPATLEVAG